jgi:predicted TIM-barrel fold metal-dependent hydrolase
MAITWELRDYDQEFFARQLDSFVPQRVFDAHAHLYRIEHWNYPHVVGAGPAVVDLATFQDQIRWLMPGREVTGLFFGVGFHQDYMPCNEFVAAETQRAPGNFCEMVVPPDLDPEQLRATARSMGFRGLKVYHTFVPQKPTWNADIPQYLNEEHARVAGEEGWTITLHMVKPRALADPVNQHWIRHYATSYPGLKLILAHAARGFNAFHTVEGIHCLRGLRNVWCDMSAVAEAPALEAIIEVLGADRLLWGSDYPISHLRGRCVSVGDQFVWLYEDTLDWKAAMPQATAQLLLVGHESLRALQHACRRMHLTDSQVEGIFFGNAQKMLLAGH